MRLAMRFLFTLWFALAAPFAAELSRIALSLVPYFAADLAINAWTTVTGALFVIVTASLFALGVYAVAGMVVVVRGFEALAPLRLWIGAAVIAAVAPVALWLLTVALTGNLFILLRGLFLGVPVFVAGVAIVTAVGHSGPHGSGDARGGPGQAAASFSITSSDIS